MKRSLAKFAMTGALTGILGFALVPLGSLTGPVLIQQAQASEIKFIVNGLPITSYDIARRTAFMKLQNKRGNLRSQAEDEMIRQALVTAEMKRVGIRISDAQVEEAFKNFAKGNRMSTRQMSGILGQAGVTAKHFKEFIRAQMGFGQAAQIRSRRGSAGNSDTTRRDAVRAMLQSNDKPTATEYLLQEIIFVVPAKDRKSQLAKRKREAQNLRNRYAGCSSARGLAKGLVDVTVRDMGRFIAQELPSTWAKEVKKLSEGKATSVKTTPRGVEFVGVCRTRTVSDDRVAELTFDEQQLTSASSDKTGNESYIAELRKNAKIIKR